jgi:multisubunit Na+/H+ antiporter MnhE subunit
MTGLRKNRPNGWQSVANKVLRYSVWVAVVTLAAFVISIVLSARFPNETANPVIRFFKAILEPDFKLTVLSWAVTLFAYIVGKA